MDIALVFFSLGTLGFAAGFYLYIKKESELTKIISKEIKVLLSSHEFEKQKIEEFDKKIASLNMSFKLMKDGNDRLAEINAHSHKASSEIPKRIELVFPAGIAVQTHKLPTPRVKKK